MEAKIGEGSIRNTPPGDTQTSVRVNGDELEALTKVLAQSPSEVIRRGLHLMWHVLIENPGGVLVRHDKDGTSQYVVLESPQP